MSMPVYTVITEEDALSSETETKIAGEINRIHSTVIKVPQTFGRMVFLSCPQGSGYAASVEAPTAAVNCVSRSGHAATEKKEMLLQLWSMFQNLTGIASDQLAISLQEIPSTMEMGNIMPAVGQE
jgi:hypothetical protein